jgi:hypothetical protein
MTDPRTRFQKVSLEDLKKLLPEQVVDGNHNHRGNEKDKKKKNKQQVAKTSKLKSRA